MEKIIGIIVGLAFTYGASAQEVDVYRINEIDPNKEYERYTFLESDGSGDQNTTYSNQSNVNKPDQNTGQIQKSTSGASENTGMVDNEWAQLNPMENVIIKEAIIYEFDVEGLEQTTENPDMLVQYYIYDKDYSEDPAYVKERDNYESAYNKKEDMMEMINDGTVVLSVIDAEEGESVWEGFAYNAYTAGASLRDKQQGLRQAVNALITQFLADNEENMVGGGSGR